MSLIRAIATVGGYTAVSRVLGFAREVLIAAFLGAGPVADAFFVAFRLPNLFRRLFGEGAFNAAFVPLMARQVEERGTAAALRFAGESLSVLTLALIVLTVAAELAMRPVVAALAPGFADDPAKFNLAVAFSAITFPYLLFMSLTALLAGMLNTLHRFAAAAAAPILLNLIEIAGLAFFAHALATPGHVLSWSVTIAGAAQFLLLVWACKRAHILPRMPLPRLTPGVKRLFRLMAPATIGAGVTQINLIVGTMIASLLPTGAIAWLNYADRLYQLPLGVVGIAIGTVLLPQLSRALRAGNHAEARENANRAIEIGLLLTLPGAAALVAIPGPIVMVLFEHGRFTAADTAGTAMAVAAYGLGLPAFVLARALTPMFHAREDTRTPVIFAGWSVGVNIALSLAFMIPLGHVGIALATSASAWLNVVQLGHRLGRDGHYSPDQRLRRRLPRMLLAAAGMAAVLWGAAWWGAAILASHATIAVFALAVLCIAGAGVYFLLAGLLGAVRLRDLRTLRRRAKL